MEVLVDTHALIWGITDESRLGTAAGVMEWGHRDPFDRMLAAQALRRGLPLLSRDVVFDDLSGLRRLW